MNKSSKLNIICLLMLTSVFYLTESYHKGTLDFTKWSEIRKERLSENYFKHFDTNKDKKISIDEFYEKYPKKLYKNHVPFNEYDLNKNEVISLDEFVKVFPGEINF